MGKTITKIKGFLHRSNYILKMPNANPFIVLNIIINYGYTEYPLNIRGPK